MNLPSLALRRSLAFLLVVAATASAADPNAPITPKPGVQIKVAAVGDSITFGMGTQNMKTDSYPAQLAQMLGPQWQVENFGVSGATLLNNGDRPYQKTRAFAPLLAFNPDVAVIMLGTNDTKNDAKAQNWSKKSEFAGDYKDLIDKLKKLPSNPRIFICHPPFVPGQGAYGINEAGVLEQIPMIDEIAKEENVGVIDVHGALKDKPELFRDRVHPVFAGATAIAATVYQALTGKAYAGAAPTPGPTPTPRPKPPVSAPSPAASPAPAQ